MRRGTLALIALVVVGGLAAWALFVLLPRSYAPQDTPASARPDADGMEGNGRQIQATLYYVSADGMHLVAVERDVAYGESTVDQARRILEEQLKPAPAPLGNAIPDGTSLRHVFVTDRGQAFVDVSREIADRHTGGSLDELFTVYTIVNTLTYNLPAVTAVQILIDGRETDTLAGHVDLRNPLGQNLRWVADSGASSAPPPSEAGS